MRLKNFRCRRLGGFSFSLGFIKKISHKDKIKWLVVLLFDQKRKKSRQLQWTACSNNHHFAKSDKLTYFSVALNGQKLLGFYPETYATSFRGSLILSARGR